MDRCRWTGSRPSPWPAIVRTAAITRPRRGLRHARQRADGTAGRLPASRPRSTAPGLARYRLASKLIKGQPLGGTRDEWVVIEPAYQAAELAGQLHDDPGRRRPALRPLRLQTSATQWFRNWVNGPSGQRLGLAPIPDDPVSLGPCAERWRSSWPTGPAASSPTKFHLKHIAVATTEGYASRPGGAQAELLAEVNKHESERNLDLLWDEFRNYQQGIMPAGPGARELTEFFAHIDAKLDPAEAPRRAKVQRSDREILNLLTKRAQRPAPGHRQLLLVHRPVPGALPQARRQPRPPTSPWSGCATRPAARRPPTTPATGPSGPSTPSRPRRSSASSARTRKTERARLQADYDRAAARPRPDRRPPPRQSRTTHEAQPPAARRTTRRRIRAAIDRLLRGDIPPGGKCDIKTLAREAGVDRTAFYGSRPYAHLREEFEQRLQALQQAGEQPDPRDAQIDRLKNETTQLRRTPRPVRRSTISELTELPDQALSRLAAQHDEITRLRTALGARGNIRSLPRPKRDEAAPATTGTHPS